MAECNVFSTDDESTPDYSRVSGIERRGLQSEAIPSGEFLERAPQTRAGADLSTEDGH